MNSVNKTLYIPLYGKSFVSKKGIILSDKKAEYIWEKEGFKLRGKSHSKWLAYYMGMRSAVFDRWLKTELCMDSSAVVLHIGCGMDSRIDRIGDHNNEWYDIDFPEVIAERRKYFEETEHYHMLAADARDTDFLKNLPKGNTIIVLEGVCMYLTSDELHGLLTAFCSHFDKISMLMDCYTEKAAKASKHKNPVNDVGVTVVYGVDEPKTLENHALSFVKEHDMTPYEMIDELKGLEKAIFKKLFAGKFARSLYRMYEYKSRS